MFTHSIVGLKYKSRLRTAAWNLILREFVEVMQSEDFGLLSPYELEGLLKHDELNIASEEIVWDAIKTWINSSHSLTETPRDYYDGGNSSNSCGAVNGPVMDLNEDNSATICYPESEYSRSIPETNKRMMPHSNTSDSPKMETRAAHNSRRSYLVHLLSLLRYSRMSLQFLSAMCSDDLIISCPPATEFMQQIFKSINTKTKQSQMAISGESRCLASNFTPGFTLPTRPRIPYSILFAIGGWEKGVPTNLIETYDLRVNKWFCFSSHFVRAYHGAQCIDGYLYLIGGTNGNEILSSLQCCDLSTGRWYERANMFHQRCYVSSVVLNGQIVAMGGHNAVSRMRSVESYDPLANQWTIMEEMNLARSDAGATVLNGKIYIAGGLNDQVIENSVEVWDGQCWSFIRPMNSPRTSLALVSYADSLYALCGNNGFER